jgi:hypothetical protein
MTDACCAIFIGKETLLPVDVPKYRHHVRQYRHTSTGAVRSALPVLGLSTWSSFEPPPFNRFDVPQFNNQELVTNSEQISGPENRPSRCGTWVPT